MGKEIQMSNEKAKVTTKVLTEEDFKLNPELEGTGLEVGDTVEIPTHAIAQVNVNENEELMVDVRQVALAEGELNRIIITEDSNGTLTLVTKGDENIKLTAIVGMLEVVKNDVMNQNKPSGQSTSEVPEMSKYDAEMIEHTIEESDFEVFPELKEAGNKVGTKIKLPRIAVNGIMEHRKLKNKAE